VHCYGNELARSPHAVPRFKATDLAPLAAGKARGDALAHHFAKRAHWVVGAVHVKASHRKVFAPQQVADQERLGARMAA